MKIILLEFKTVYYTDLCEILLDIKAWIYLEQYKVLKLHFSLY